MTHDEYIFLEDETGELHRVSYADLDTDIYPKLWKPVGLFSYSASSFLNLPLTEVPFYVKDWLPKQGKAEIYGGAKAGKSFLCAQLARSVGAGESFLGIPVEQGKVLYIQSELGTGTLQHRMKQTDQHYDNVFVGTTFSMRLDTKEGQGLLYNELDAVAPDVLILDPLYKMISGDENEAKDMEIIVNFIDVIIEIYGCSVVVIHHAGKDVSRGGRGSSVLEDWVDSYIELRRTSPIDEPLRSRLTPKLLRHAMASPEPMNLVLGDNFEFQLGEKQRTIKDLVAETIQERGVVKMQELIDLGIGSKKSVYDARKQLLAEGVINDAGEGFYEWVEPKAT